MAGGRGDNRKAHHNFRVQFAHVFAGESSHLVQLFVFVYNFVGTMHFPIFSLMKLYNLPTLLHVIRHLSALWTMRRSFPKQDSSLIAISGFW